MSEQHEQRRLVDYVVDAKEILRDKYLEHYAGYEGEGLPDALDEDFFSAEYRAIISQIEPNWYYQWADLVHDGDILSIECDGATNLLEGLSLAFYGALCSELYDYFKGDLHDDLIYIRGEDSN